MLLPCRWLANIRYIHTYFVHRFLFRAWRRAPGSRVLGRPPPIDLLTLAPSPHSLTAGSQRSLVSLSCPTNAGRVCGATVSPPCGTTGRVSRARYPWREKKSWRSVCQALLVSRRPPRRRGAPNDGGGALFRRRPTAEKGCCHFPPVSLARLEAYHGLAGSQ